MPMHATVNRSAVTHPTVQIVARPADADSTLWGVVFEGRIRVSVVAADNIAAEVAARKLVPPGLAVVKVYPR